jgi:hypothetical protein
VLLFKKGAETTGNALRLKWGRTTEEGRTYQDTNGTFAGNSILYSKVEGREDKCTLNEIRSEMLPVELERPTPRYFSYDKKTNIVSSELKSKDGYVVIPPKKSVLVKWFVSPKVFKEFRILAKGKYPSHPDCQFGRINEYGNNPTCGFSDENNSFLIDLECYPTLVAKNTDSLCITADCRLDFAYFALKGLSIGINVLDGNRKPAVDQRMYYRLRPVEGNSRDQFAKHKYFTHTPKITSDLRAS